MRRTGFAALVLAMLIAVTLPLSAQEPPPTTIPPMLLNLLERQAAGVQVLATAIKREAFIVQQLVSATAQFHDEFQKHAAIEKAYDRILLAQRRSVDNPPAPPQVRTAVSQALDVVDQARQNPSSADLAALERQILAKTADVQPWLFRELDDARKQKFVMRDILAKLNASNDQLDEGVNDALSSTIEFFKAGGGR